MRNHVEVKRRVNEQLDATERRLDYLDAQVAVMRRDSRDPLEDQ
jgi:hypothetical protein